MARQIVLPGQEKVSSVKKTQEPSGRKAALRWNPCNFIGRIGHLNEGKRCLRTHLHKI